MTYDASLWHILPNMASTAPVWPVVGNGVKLWSRKSSLNEIVHFKAQLKNLSLVYQVTACTSLWDKIGQISSKVAYNDPIIGTVPRYNRLEPHMPHYLFCAVLALCVRFDHIKFEVQGKRESGQKWSIIIQYEPLKRDMTNYGHIWHRISNTDQFSASAPEKATYALRRQRVAYTA